MDPSICRLEEDGGEDFDAVLAIVPLSIVSSMTSSLSSLSPLPIAIDVAEEEEDECRFPPPSFGYQTMLLSSTAEGSVLVIVEALEESS